MSDPTSSIDSPTRTPMLARQVVILRVCVCTSTSTLKPTTLLRALSSSTTSDLITHSKLVPSKALSITFSRSGGKGGQNVNKVNTKATLAVNLTSDWIDPSSADRLLSQNGAWAKSDNTLVLSSSKNRTQKANIKDVIARLEEAVAVALVEPKERNMRTGIANVTKQNRKNDKRRRSDVKQNRRSVDW